MKPFPRACDNESWEEICVFLSSLEDWEQEMLLKAEKWTWGRWSTEDGRACLIVQLPHLLRDEVTVALGRKYDLLCEYYTKDRIVTLIKRFLTGLK